MMDETVTGANAAFPHPMPVADSTKCDCVTASEMELPKAIKVGYTGGNESCTPMSIKPEINASKVKFVLDNLPKKGGAWARSYMELVEGFARWPAHVRQAVEAQERIDAEQHGQMLHPSCLVLIHSSMGLT